MECDCPTIVRVSQCYCRWKYGRFGYECIKQHPDPVGGVCGKSDVVPMYCGDSCNR